MHLMFLATLLTQNFWQKWQAPLRPSFLQTSSSDSALIKTPPTFIPFHPPRKKKKEKRKKKAQLNLLFISTLVACRDNFPHREIRTQWRAWLSRRLLLAREITPRVRCIVWMAAMAEFGSRSFLAPLCKLTLSRLPSVAVYHQRSVWPRCPPAFYASLSIWSFSCLFGLFRIIYL